MENKIFKILCDMSEELNYQQLEKLQQVLLTRLSDETEIEEKVLDNNDYLELFVSAKRVEGCTERTIEYYRVTIEKMLDEINIPVRRITTEILREYLTAYQMKNNCSKVTIDNLRRIFSSFFSWLEDEDYITKSPVRRIHKVRTDILVKEVLSDESMEVLRDSCTEIRDIAMIDLLASTGIRVGELVKMNRDDIDFQERQCVVFGKGNKEREVYFNARTKIHLKRYLEQRTDSNPALFVGLSSPYTRLSISGVESRLRLLGKRANILKVHPHKFRRTLATMAIDKGMPIEQVQKLLIHGQVFIIRNGKCYDLMGQEVEMEK